MIGLLYYTVITSFVADYRDLSLALGSFGKVLPLLCEAGSFLLLIGILLTLAARRQIAIAPKYLLLGAALSLHLIFGMILNWATAGTVVAGIRDYFRFVPLFILPAVVEISERDLRRLLKLIVLLCLMQLPVSIYQRLILYPVYPTGDIVRGTLPTGSMTSILLICSIGCLAALWQRGFLSLLKLLTLGIAMLIPTMINETKATILLFACAMLALGILSASGRRWLIQLSASLLISVSFVLAFATLYDHFFPDNYGGIGLVNFYTQRAIENEYLGIDDPSEVREVPRIDSIVLAYKKLRHDPTELMFGLGMGNVSNPERNQYLEGKFPEIYMSYNIDRTTYTQTLWEIGLVGILLILLLTLFVFTDARRIAREPSFVGAFGLGWAVVMAVLPLALLYKSLLHAPALVVLLMFFSGYFAAARVRLARSAMSAALAALGASGHTDTKPNPANHMRRSARPMSARR